MNNGYGEALGWNTHNWNKILREIKLENQWNWPFSLRATDSKNITSLNMKGRVMWHNRLVLGKYFQASRSYPSLTTRMGSMASGMLRWEREREDDSQELLQWKKGSLMRRGKTWLKWSSITWSECGSRLNASADHILLPFMKKLAGADIKVSTFDKSLIVPEQYKDYTTVNEILVFVAVCLRRP